MTNMAAPHKLPKEMSLDEFRQQCLDLHPLHELYERGTFVGEGSFGRVSSGTRRDDGRLAVAIKELVKSGEPEPERRYEYYAIRNRRRLLREPYFLKLEGNMCKNLLKFYTAHEVPVGISDKYGKPINTLVVVTEFAAGGDLLNHLNSVIHGGARPYTEDVARGIIRTVATAVQALHARGVLHRDIKAENVLLRSQPGQELDPDRDVILCDVGLACFKLEAEDKDDPLVPGAGTSAYMSPESQGLHGTYSEAGDVWALGVLLFVMLCGEYPFGSAGAPREDTGPFVPTSASGRAAWSTLDAHARDLIQGLLTFDRTKRITLDQMLTHPWPSATSSSQPLTAAVRGLQALTSAKVMANVLAGARIASVAGAAAGSSLGEAVGAFGRTLSQGETGAVSTALAHYSGSDGRLDLTAFRHALTGLGLALPDELTRRVFDAFDTDQDGRVDHNEVLAGIATISRRDEITFDFLFDLFDTHGTGQVQLQELSSGFAVMHAPLVGALSKTGSRTGYTMAGPAAEDVTFQYTVALQRLLLGGADSHHGGVLTREQFRQAVKDDKELAEVLLRPLKELAGIVIPARPAPGADGAASALASLSDLAAAGGHGHGALVPAASSASGHAGDAGTGASTSLLGTDHTAPATASLAPSHDQPDASTGAGPQARPPHAEATMSTAAAHPPPATLGLKRQRSNSMGRET